MKAFTLRSYGSADRLELTDTDVPVPADDEVLVRVRATSVNPYDWHHMRGEPSVVRLMPGTFGLRAPKFSILGCDMAGQVEAVGSSVSGFRPGDEVFGLLKSGAFAEYVSVRAGELVRKPSNLSYEQAAAVPMAAVTALVALRDAGGLKPGHKVLVNGASGGVGTFAVQIARALGASVAGVCSARHVDLVRSLGAAEVIDYGAADFTRRGQSYDLMLDVAGSRSAIGCRRVLTRRGTLVLVGGPAGPVGAADGACDGGVRCRAVHLPASRPGGRDPGGRERAPGRGDRADRGRHGGPRHRPALSVRGTSGGRQVPGGGPRFGQGGRYALRPC